MTETDKGLETIEFKQAGDRLILSGLPQKNPDPCAGVTVLKLECDAPPRQVLGGGCVVIK